MAKNLTLVKTWNELRYQASLNQADNNLMQIRKFGQNLDIDTGSEEDIWFNGGAKVIPTAAETFNISSTSAQYILIKGEFAESGEF